jgi:hypothetical protein
MQADSTDERSNAESAEEPSPLRQALHRMRSHLTVIAGHAQLLQRRFARSRRLEDEERAGLERSTTVIGASTRALAKELDQLDPDIEPEGNRARRQERPR